MHPKDTPSFESDAMLTHILGFTSASRALLGFSFIGKLCYYHAHFRTVFHWIVTLVPRTFYDCLSLDCYVSVSCNSRIFFSFHCYVSVSHTFGIYFHRIVTLVSRALLGFFFHSIVPCVFRALRRILFHLIVTFESCVF